MTCKDCLYYERCHSEIAYGMGSDDLTGKYFTDIETRCNHFKNKADVVEVVRCKNCEFYKLRNVSSRYKPTKPCCLRKAAIKVNENDFCSYGKKKEGV